MTLGVVGEASLRWRTLRNGRREAEITIPVVAADDAEFDIRLGWDSSTDCFAIMQGEGESYDDLIVVTASEWEGFLGMLMRASAEIVAVRDAHGIEAAE